MNRKRRMLRRKIDKLNLLTLEQAVEEYNKVVEAIPGRRPISLSRIYQLVKRKRVEVEKIGDQMFIHQEIIRSFARQYRRPGRPRKKGMDVELEERLKRAYGAKPIIGDGDSDGINTYTGSESTSTDTD